MNLGSMFLGEDIIMSGNAKYHSTRGTLYLTNRRLAFVYEKRGIMSQNKYTPVNLPLNTISEVAVVGTGPFKKVSVYTYKDKLPTGLPRYEFKVHGPESWTLKIEKACSGSTPEKIVVPMKCPVCGTRIELAQTECPVCGAQLT